MTIYPPAAHQEMKKWRSKKAYNRAWPLGVDATAACECKNCGDIRYLYVAFIKAGPFQSPPNLKEGQTLKWCEGDETIKQGWYIVHNLRAYECPVCMGASRVADPAEKKPPMRKDLPF